MEFNLDELDIENKQDTKPTATEEFNPFHILGVPLNASSLEIREAYLRLKSTFQSSNDSMYSLMSPEEAEATLNEMDRAYDELRDIDSRGKYLKLYDPQNTQSATKYAAVRENLNIQKDSQSDSRFSNQVNEFKGDDPTVTRVIGSLKVKADKVDSDELQSKLREILENCTPGTGATIEALRIAAGLTIKDIEFHTKFSYQIINAIEKDDFGTLPASIYVRGFLKNFFKFLAMGTQRSFIDAYTERQTSAKH